MEENETSTLVDINETFCGQFDVDAMAPYYFYCDGVLVSIVAIIGVIGNVVALIVLSRPRLNDVFHQLLLALACFDILYLIFGGINYTFRGFKVRAY